MERLLDIGYELGLVITLWGTGIGVGTSFWVSGLTSSSGECIYSRELWRSTAIVMPLLIGALVMISVP
jgi:hypothetical protein